MISKDHREDLDPFVWEIRQDTTQVLMGDLETILWLMLCQDGLKRLIVVVDCYFNCLKDAILCLFVLLLLFVFFN